MPFSINGSRQRQIMWARVGVLASFGASGLLTATFASRLVLVRESLGVSPGGMGLLLVANTLGSVLSMPFMGRLIERFGDIVVIRVCSTVAWCALVVVAIFASRGWAYAVAIPLVFTGAGNGSWDVAQNLAGTKVEQAMGRSIMPQFHAAFSLATLVGAGIGWIFSHLGTDLLTHVGVAAGLGLIVVWTSTFILLKPSDTVQPTAEIVEHPAPPVRSAWLEPRTLLIGVVMLSVSLTEGSANDWIASGVVQSFATPETTGIACLGVFLAAMTLMRILGTRLIDSWGRVATLRWCAVCAIIGLLAFGLGPSLWFVVPGAAVWGLGAALGFPVGISAASDDPLLAARRTAVVSTLAYLAFLGGPALLGKLADHLGFRGALLVILVPAVLSLLLAGWLAPLKPHVSTSGAKFA